MSFIQGYIATLSVNGSTLNTYSSDASLSLTNATLDKTTLGVTNRQYITGLQDGTLSINMHMDTTGMGLIQAAFADADPVAFVFRPGALSTADAGQWAGNCIVTDITMNGAVDDNWNVSLAAQITGTVTYTAAA